jgi:hypothetical protein
MKTLIHVLFILIDCCKFSVFFHLLDKCLKIHFNLVIVVLCENTVTFNYCFLILIDRCTLFLFIFIFVALGQAPEGAREPLRCHGFWSARRPHSQPQRQKEAWA